MVKQKIGEWLKRYLPAEIIGTVSAVGVASITNVFYTNPIFVAYAGSLGESIGFYSTILIQNIIIVGKKYKIENKQFNYFTFINIISNIVLEFGFAGMIDGFILRPFFMYLFPIVLRNFTLGIILGKIVGDVTFYLLVILSYEIKKATKK